MDSEGRGRPEGTAGGGDSAVARLASVLAAVTGGGGAAAEAGPTPRELAELLWFAEQLGDTGGEESQGPGRAAAPARQSRHPSPAAAPPRPTPPAPAPQRSPTPPPDGRIPLHLPDTPDAPGSPGTPPLLAPAPPMLPHPLALQRALRPLKRKVPSTRARLLDERATADRIARLGGGPDVWLPVLRPAPDRWLRLNLVYDAGPTMPVWRPLVRELHTVLAQSGVFRTVTVHRATPDGRAHQVPALADGRTVTLVVSDCMGPQWHPGPAGDRWYRTLRRWASRMPVAVVQPLPEHLWHTTALPAAPGLLTAPTAAAPSAALTFVPYEDTAPEPHPGAVPLPVLEPAPAWLANWAALVAAPGGGHAPGALARLPRTPVPPAEPAPDIAELAAEDLVLRFRATASPEAFRIAGHLALATPSLPVMRLVQRALDCSPRPQHLAEIILSGLLTAIPGPPGSYEFRPGVRELLLRSLPRTARTRTREFLARVGGLIDERAGLAAGEFRAEARRDAGRAFATVRAETVRRLGGEAEEGLVGGRYRLLGLRGPSQRMWAAVDVRTDRPVVVHRYPRQDAPQERFAREALALAGLRHPNVVPVLDYGVEGERPFLVAEFVDGVTLAELQLGSGPGVSFRVYAQLVADVVPALEALHARGLVRGQEGWDGLLLRPNGSVVLSRFALGEQSEGHDERSDFLMFRSLLRELASHSPASLRFQRILAELARGDDPVEAVRRLPRSAALDWSLGGTEADRLHITLLGPPSIGRGGRALTLPSPEAQALLCVLLLRQGRRVTHTELAESLWEQPPSDLQTMRRLHELATELRQCLGPGTLAELSDGYALHLPGDYVDIHHCEELVHERTFDMATDAERSMLQDALSLYYGDPLDGVPGPAAKATRARLRALRLTLCVTRAELDLELGDFEQAATDLTALVREHPDREDLRRLHILALKGTGRIAEAMESYESYAELRQRRHGDPVDPALHELYLELRSAPERERPTIAFEAAGSDEREALGRVVTQLLARGDLASHQYEVLARDHGYVVRTEPDAHVLPVLVSLLRDLPEALVEIEDRPRLRVTFWHAPFAEHTRPAVRALLDTPDADVLVVVSPTLYERFADSTATLDLARFEPLRTGGESSAPLAWYCALHLPGRAADERDRDLVRGPFVTPNVGRLTPDPGRTAFVLVPDDGPMTVLPATHPLWRRPLRPTTYYEVDLTVHRTGTVLSLPGSAGATFVATAELAWHVEDPVAFVRGEVTDVADVLLRHVATEASRITRRYPLRRAGAAQQAVRERLHSWPVPGLSVTCSVQLAGETQPAQPAPAPRQPFAPTSPATTTDLLRTAEIVLLGFEGPLTSPFTAKAARSAALELLSLVVDHRDPQDALTGRPLTGDSRGPIPLQEELVHPLEVLRAFADNSDLAPLLRDRLDLLELRAVAKARATPHSSDLVRTLHDSGRRLAVVTDFCARAVHHHLVSRELPMSAVFGRLRRLMPDPERLRLALTHFGRTAEFLLISSTAAEVTAARHRGIPVIGYADSPTTERRLRKAGCDLIVDSLEPLLDAARSL
ncbi:serine/threonine protein kinase [Streptomyces ferrugineus]|uniref:Serine/threonine protein kinase n=1 Tax=Streptomyces ferrugineus TaxID=1413221 RepID=A0A7M2STB8_9ACTN|nr:SAV_2336 N-terminal domain-related protein [Streptomyces ferrugineus]QOV38531.1 serine/threonine protein kinase [Streptomyces ferrugineus]